MNLGQKLVEAMPAESMWQSEINHKKIKRGGKVISTPFVDNLKDETEEFHLSFHYYFLNLFGSLSDGFFNFDNLMVGNLNLLIHCFVFKVVAVVCTSCSSKSN